MIHGTQYHKPIPQPTKPVEKPPTLAQLQAFIAAGPDVFDVAQAWIDKFKLPYRVDVKDGQATIAHTLSRGELFLQKFITQDKDTLEMLDDARLIALSNHDVLIIGETGTGKELIANAMIAGRSGLIKIVNCAGLPDNLIESELFGHEKGSFTGAIKDKEGMMAEAKDGVMFLDEISELPLHLQSKLLRVLQEKKIRKVGSNSEESINCKFVCATNKSLEKMVDEGKFKKDLFARISTLELHIKPLRERKEDVPLICASIDGGQKFLEKCSDKLDMLKLDCNVRSLIQAVIRYNVLGRLVI